MKYFVKWYDEEEYKEVGEDFMNAYSTFNESLEEMKHRYCSPFPTMILKFDRKKEDNMYFTKSGLDGGAFLG